MIARIGNPAARCAINPRAIRNCGALSSNGTSSPFAATIRRARGG